MKPVTSLTVAEQVAEHMRSQIVEQRMRGDMPGIHQLAANLMVNHKTVKAALEILQKEGLLVSQGLGKPRRIRIEGLGKALTLRIAILLYEPDDRKIDHILGAVHQLVEAGHHPFYTTKTLIELSMNVNAVSRLVSRTESPRRSGIVSFHCGSMEPREIYQRLRALGVTCAVRGDAIRLSPHFYQDQAVLDDALDALETIISE